MLSVTEALKRCLDLEINPSTEDRPLIQCAGARLASPLAARAALPRWDQSAMDGYAIHHGDAISGATLKVVDVIPAGTWPEQSIQRGEAARIFTGAPIPDGADTVIIQENCSPSEDEGLGHVLIHQNTPQGKNIRRRGEEIEPSTHFASAKDLVTPGLLGLCAAQGYAQLNVYRSPRIALLETGAELISPGQTLTGAQIYATHEVTLAPMIQLSGGQLVHSIRVNDSVDEVVHQLHTLLHEDIDLILTTGGVSVGDFDPLHEALTRLGAERHFWKVKMKPGKPISVASLTRGTTQPSLPIFSLPGNPVSCVVGYLLFVHPLIQRAAGVPKDELGMTQKRCILTSAITKNHTRAEFLRVRVSKSHDGHHDGQPELAGNALKGKGHQGLCSCEVTGGQSSGWISSVAYGDGLLWVPAKPTSWPVGQEVDVLLFPWSKQS